MARPEPPTGAYVPDRYRIKDPVWVYTSGRFQFEFVGWELIIPDREMARGYY